MGLHAHRVKFWPFHRRRLKLRLFSSYDINGAHYIVTDVQLNPNTGALDVHLTPYNNWAEEVRIK